MADLLDEYIARERLKPFEWSSRANGDCYLFGLGWAAAMGCRDVASAWRGRYGSEDEARALLDSRGGAIGCGCEMLGPPAMGAPARRGDVGLMAFDGWPLGMICTGTMWAFRHGTRGVRMIRCEPEIFWNLGFKPKCHKHSGS